MQLASQLPIFKMGRPWGASEVLSASEALWGPPAGCRGEMTALCIPLWEPVGYPSDSLPRVVPGDTQIRCQNPIGCAILISRVPCSNKFKSSSIYKFHPVAKWIKALVAFESLYLGDDLLCLNFHTVSIGGNGLLGRVNISAVWKYAPSSPEHVPESSDAAWNLLLLN